MPSKGKFVDINLAKTEDLENFFGYLDTHLSENGREDVGLFQPLSKKESKVSDVLRSKFSIGISSDYGDTEWRRLWLAKNDKGEVIGHIDIRSHPESNAPHRVLLGMGVDSNIRRNGLGQRLLQEVIDYCCSIKDIAWLDLWVVSSNAAARSLYQKLGFSIKGEIDDMFRIDDKSYGYVTMSLYVGN